jgi:DNA-directed RNA polymerase specialized sigma24 family protein
LPVPGWSDIPSDFLTRVAAADRTVLGPLAAWLHGNPPRRISEDLVQKVLATLCKLMSNDRGRSLLRGARSLPNLLASIASRHRNDELRAEMRLRSLVEKVASRRRGPAATVDPSSLLSRAELRKAILAGFMRLQPIERDALVRALVFGQSYRHIARSLLGRSRGAADEQQLRTLVFRARRKLQARLGDLRFP